MSNIFDDMHYGNMLLTKPKRNCDFDIYEDTGIEETNEYKYFSKKMRVYGITFIANDNVSDDFLLGLAELTKGIFSRNGKVDLILQEQVLINMYRYSAVIPVVSMDDIDTMESKLLELRKENSIPDIIIEGGEFQANEIIEHLLHFITLIGLNYTFQDEWGANSRSEVYRCMVEASEKKFYYMEKYDSIPAEINTICKVEEFSYWVIMAMWNFLERYCVGLGEEEWTLRNKDSLRILFPEAYELYVRTLANVLSQPDFSILDNYDKSY